MVGLPVRRASKLGGPHSRQGIAALFAGATFIASAPIFAVLAHEWTALPPSVTAMWRTALAAPVLWAIICWSKWRAAGQSAPSDSGADARPSAERLRLGLLLPGLFFAADLLSWHTAMTAISAGGATFLANLAALIVPLVAWVWFGERPTARFFGGTALALLGCALLLSRPSSSVLSTLPDAGSRYLLGNLLGVLTAVWYAGYQLSLSWLRRWVDALRVMAWTALACGGALLLVSLAFGLPLLPGTALGWLPLVGMALFAQLLGQGLIIWSAEHVSASVLSVGLLWQPLAASLLGFVVLGQRLGALQVVGVGAVLVGLLLVARASRDGRRETR